MADPAEFSPVELDRLEDALDSVELAQQHDDSSIAVRRRLQDYRRILELSRAAMPMVEVPRGLLDNVLAEARAAAELPVVTPIAGAAERARTSVWTRLRRALLLPGVALAATAALVLLIVDRNDPSSEAPSVGAAQRVASNDDNARVSTAGKLTSETRADGKQAGPESPPPPPATAPSTPTPSAGVAAPATTVVPGAPVEEARKADKSGRAEDAPLEETAAEKKVADPAADKPATLADADQEAGPRWDIIVRGDRARHKDDCAKARSEYMLALADTDARVLARAHAGLGLCAAASGDRSAADAAYKQARELDAEIVGFIDNERPRGAGSNNAAKAAKKPKAAAPQQAAENAFEADERALDPFGN